MNDHAFDRLVRFAGPARDRRTSLKALGAAAVATALARPNDAAAKKGGKHSGNRCKKRCKKATKQCRRTIAAACQVDPDPVACRVKLQRCCETCNVNTAVSCVLRLLRPNL